jgi:putative ABC transport system permease protein
MYDVRYALRSLRRQPGFTALALITLALGIGATTTAFAVLDTVLIRPLPYANPDRLVLLREKNRTGALQAASYPNFADWRNRARSFSGLASAQFPQAQTVTVGSKVSRVTTMGVSRGFFSVLGAPPVVGREFTADENREGGAPVVMVSYDFWQTQMGGRRPLGTIQLGGTPVPVVGVARAGFKFIDEADVYWPHEQEPGTCRTCRNYRVVARLAPGVTETSARAEMTGLSRSLLATYGIETSAVDADLAPLHEYVVGRYRVTFAVVLAAAVLVLLVACTNLVSAQLARGLSRGRELAVRSALGAPRGRVVRQLFLESGMLAVAGAMLGVGLAIVFTRVVRLLGAGLVPRIDELHVDASVLAFAVALSVVTSVLIGLYPALRLSGGDPGSLLHGTRGSGQTVRASVWRWLVGFEIATAIVLLVGSMLLVRTMRNILTADTGIQVHGVVTASLVPDDTVNVGKLAQLGDELGSLPGVSGVAFANHLPLDWGSTAGPVRRTTDPADHDFPAMAGFRLVSNGYFDVMHQPVVRGRAFTSSDRDGAPMVAIITPGIANALWPGRNPVGERIVTNYLWNQALTVVGVVAEASLWSMPRGAQNEIYVPFAQHPTRSEGQLVAFIRTTRDAGTVIPSLRARLHDVAPTMPATLGTLDDRISTSAADRRFATVALTIFGGIALVLAAIGIYGTMSYTVAARTHEIGVRLALGATPFQVRAAELTDAGSVALAGILVGLTVGFLATRFLASTLYGVSRVDPTAYAAAATIVLAAALVGAYVPSRRSSRVDPLRALRAE